MWQRQTSHLNYMNSFLISWSQVLLEQLAVAQLAKKINVNIVIITNVFLIKVLHLKKSFMQWKHS